MVSLNIQPYVHHKSAAKSQYVHLPNFCLVLSKVYEDRHAHEASSPVDGRVMKTIHFERFPLFLIMVHSSTRPSKWNLSTMAAKSEAKCLSKIHSGTVTGWGY